MTAPRASAASRGVVIGFLFPGQGVDPPWVAAEVVADPAVAPLIDAASAATQVDVARLLVRGGRDLTRVEVLQPAMVAVCLGVHRLLATAGVRADVIAGHSLGELTAWAASGAISHEDAIAVAALRGRLMGRQAERSPGGMVQIDGHAADCERIIAASAYALVLAAHNAPREWVLSGGEAAVAAAVRTHGGTRLAVAGSWHSPAMADVVEELRTALSALPRLAPHAPALSNRDAAPLGDDAPARLAQQLVLPVNWVATMRALAARGVTRYLALGPGKALRSLVRRNLADDVEVEIVDDLRAVAAAARHGVTTTAKEPA